MTSSDKQVVEPVEKQVRDIIRLTTTIHKTIKWNGSYSLYFDYFEIANYRLASIDSTLLLSKNKRYKEAFANLRTELEQMMLFSLMTRGKRYFLLFKKFKKESDAAAITRMNADIATAKANGKKTSALRAENYPRDGVVKIIYEGPYVNGEKKKGNLVPYYLNLYKNYDPKYAFLDDTQYFQYLHSRFNQRINQKRKQESKYLYTHYMSYAALLQSLTVNRLITKKQTHRLAAHYNFLSEFVHPTSVGIERLKVRNSQNAFINSLEQVREDYPSLRLLATLYAGNIAASFAEDILYVLKNAPKRYVGSYDEKKLRKCLDDFYKTTDYFWFIKNQPHSYDKFYHCVHYEQPNAAKLKNNYNNVENSKVRFRSNVMERFTSLQMGWSNTLWKSYKPPFTLSK